MRQSTAFVALIVSTPIAIAVMVFSREILGIYGDGFEIASTALKILVSLQLIHVSVGSVALWLMMSKKENYALLAQSVSFVATTLMCFYFIPEYGSIGAAYSYAAGMILYNIICATFVYLLIGINPTSFGFIANMLLRKNS